MSPPPLRDWYAEGMNAAPAREFVRVQRTAGIDELICQPIRSSADSIVASELSGSLDLDGLCLVPMNTVRRLDRDFDKAAFYKAAISVWPVDEARERLSNQLTAHLRNDLSVLMRRGEFVAIEMAVDDPDVAYVGTLLGVSAEELSLSRVTSRGDRILEPLMVPLKALTKVEIGTRYLRATRHAHAVLTARSTLSDGSGGTS